jgi:outer membrane protein TolC
MIWHWRLFAADRRADSQAVPEGEFLLPDKQAISLEEATQMGLKQRTELELADINSQIMEIRYNAEKGNYLPNIALSADYSLFTAADDYGIQRDDFGKKYGLSIGFQIPLFTGFSNTSKRNYARHDYQQARLMQRDSEELIALQIRQDHQKLNNAWENYRFRRKTSNWRNAAWNWHRFDMTTSGYPTGSFDAQIMLQAIKLQYIRRSMNYLGRPQFE